MAQNVLFIKHGCPACLGYKRWITSLNCRLPLSEQIIVLDNYEYENFGIVSNPIQLRIDPKEFDSYPLAYFDGIIIKSGATGEMFRFVLVKHFADKTEIPFVNLYVEFENSD